MGITLPSSITIQRNYQKPVIDADVVDNEVCGTSPPTDDVSSTSKTSPSTGYVGIAMKWESDNSSGTSDKKNVTKDEHLDDSVFDPTSNILSFFNHNPEDLPKADVESPYTEKREVRKRTSKTTPSTGYVGIAMNWTNDNSPSTSNKKTAYEG